MPIMPTRKNVDEVLADLAARVAAEKTVVDSATLLINGLRIQLAAAIAAASVQGLSDAQLAGFQAIADGLDAANAELSAAIAATVTVAVDPNNPS